MVEQLIKMNKLIYLYNFVTSVIHPLSALCGKIFNHKERQVLKTSLILIFHFSFLTFNLHSQDIHFSQYNQSPLNLNPALTGVFNGEYRFVGNHRRQWASVTVPYQTFGLSVDAKSPIKKLPNLSAGLALYTDKAGDSDFGTTQVNLSGAYRIRLSSDSSQHIVIGIQSGVTQRKLNYNKLTFDSQYNGYQYDATLGNNEVFEKQQRVYANLNGGMVYTKKFSERTVLLIGASLFNISKPKQSFNGDNLTKLDRRLDFNGQFKFSG